ALAVIQTRTLGHGKSMPSSRDTSTWDPEKSAQELIASGSDAAAGLTGAAIGLVGGPAGALAGAAAAPLVARGLRAVAKEIHARALAPRQRMRVADTFTF